MVMKKERERERPRMESITAKLSELQVVDQQVRFSLTYYMCLQEDNGLWIA